MRTFSYVASFSLIDAFGNPYPMVASPAWLVPVQVSGAKVILLEGARLILSAGLYTLAAAAILAATATTLYQAIAAAVIAAIGGNLSHANPWLNGL